jgi:hypothetical protein
MFPMMRTVPLRSQQLFKKCGPRIRLTEAGSVYKEFTDAPMLLTVRRKLGLDDWKRCMIKLKGVSYTGNFGRTREGAIDRQGLHRLQTVTMIGDRSKVMMQCNA